MAENINPKTSTANLINWDGIDAFVADACGHYADNPPVIAHLEGLCLRLQEDLTKVTLFEVSRVLGLLENEQWMDDNYAANLLFKVRDLVGLDNTGGVSF